MKDAMQVSLREVRHTAGFSSIGFRSTDSLSLDPFLNIDLFRMTEPTFPPHPHAGFSAVTYMLPESSGAFQNRDSLGDRSTINPGDLHWTQAGAGMMHEEVPLVRGTECLGFQIFVNLRRTDKGAPPRVLRVSRSRMPILTQESATIVVVVGSYKTASAPVGPLATSIDMLDCKVEPHGALSLELKPAFRWFLFGISGSARSDSGMQFGERQITVFPAESATLSLDADGHGFRFLLCGGQPIGEPVVRGGPFAMTNESELRNARERFSAGMMGRLSPSF